MTFRLPLFESGSPVWSVPQDTQFELVVALNAVAFSLEMTALAHARLRETLHALAERRDRRDNLHVATAALLDAWSVVDGLHRSAVLLEQLLLASSKATESPLPVERPLKEPNGMPEPWRSFFASAEPTRLARNGFHHLNEKFRQVVDAQKPAMGILHWVHATPDHFAEGWHQHAYLAGSVITVNATPISPLKRLTFTPPVDHIRLEALSYNVYLSDAVIALQDVAKHLEEQLAAQFAGRMPHAPGLHFWLELKWVGNDARTTGT